MDACSTTLAPYQRGRVSLPEKRDSVPDISSLVGDRGRTYLAGAGERMLDPNTDDVHDDGAERCYVDPQLASKPALYARFVRDLRARDMLVFGKWAHERTGLFFVRKKCGKLRLILDARRTNRRFAPPPRVDLLTAEGLGRIEVELPDDQDFSSLYCGTADVQDAFHRMGIPLWLSRWFGLPRFRAGDVGITETVDGVVDPDDWVTPMPRCLPMGFSWSLFFAQDVDEEVASQALSRAELLRDRGHPLVLTLRGALASSTRHYIYVDNIGVFGSDGRVVASKLEDVCAAFETRGLAVHEVSVSDSGVEALGVLLDGRRRHTRLTAKRFWRVRGALLALASRRKISGRQVEAIIGHATFCGLVRRETLSVFSTVYPFIRKHYDMPVLPWPSVCDELRVFAGLMIMLVSSWESDWNPLVLATDASEWGYGICSRWFSPDDVAAVGRCREADRYLSEAHVAARAAALGLGETLYTAGVPTEVPDISALDGCLGRADLTADPTFAEVPPAMTDEQKWTVVGGWKFAEVEDIMVLEARALLRGLERVTRTRFGRNLRQVIFADNLGLVLSVGRWRCRSFKILVILRRMAAWCLSRNAHLAVRWIPSEKNPADGPSRLFQPGKSVRVKEEVDEDRPPRLKHAPLGFTDTLDDAGAPLSSGPVENSFSRNVAASCREAPGAASAPPDGSGAAVDFCGVSNFLCDRDVKDNYVAAPRRASVAASAQALHVNEPPFTSKARPSAGTFTAAGPCDSSALEEEDCAERLGPVRLTPSHFPCSRGAGLQGPEGVGQAGCLLGADGLGGGLAAGGASRAPRGEVPRPARLELGRRRRGRVGRRADAGGAPAHGAVQGEGRAGEAARVTDSARTAPPYLGGARCREASHRGPVRPGGQPLQQVCPGEAGCRHPDLGAGRPLDGVHRPPDPPGGVGCPRDEAAGGRRARSAQGRQERPTYTFSELAGLEGLAEPMSVDVPSARSVANLVCDHKRPGELGSLRYGPCFCV